MTDCRALTLIQIAPPRYEWATDQQVLDALEEHDFHIANTAKFFGVPRHMLARRIEETPDLVLASDDWRETVVDDAQNHYVKGARAGNAIAVAGVLNALGKSRGFGKQDQNSGEAIVVEVRQLRKEG